MKDKLLSLRKQAEVKDRWLEARLERILSVLMKEADIDMWIICSRENNEDPVLKTFLPSPMLAAGRSTILLFFLKDDDTLECISLGRPGSSLEKFYKSVWLNQEGSDWSKYL